MLASAETALHDYVFPEVGAKTIAMLRANTPRYERLADAKAFVAAVNADLFESTRDKHVRVAYPFDTALLGQSQTSQTQGHRLEVLDNYGFREVRRLPGNVGYLDFGYFSNDAGAAQVIEGAMRFISATDAFIIDLRHNGGGSPRAAETLEAYFFDQPQQITSIVWRDPKTGKTSEVQQYTAATVPGPLYLSKPVYLLTGPRTFSCAEQFVYDLHNLKRVTTVGETTGGGANPGDFHAIGAQFAIFVPDGRAYSNVTKRNWEGTGIAPDVAASAGTAFERAYTLALHDVQKRDKNADVQDEVSQALSNPAKALEP